MLFHFTSAGIYVLLISSHQSFQTNMKPYFLSFVASLSFFVVGYDSVVKIGWKLFVENIGMATYQLNIVSVAGNICAVVSAMVGGICADVFGRKYPLVVAGLMFCAGNLLKCTATSSYVALSMGQAATGIGVGLTFTISPLYIAELVPAPVRGLLISATEVSLNLGILVGYIAHQTFMVFSPSVAQKLLFGVALFPSVLFTLGMAAMPESPFWLIVKRGQTDDARTILEGSQRSPAEVDHIIDHVHQEQNHHLTHHLPIKIVWNKLVRPPLRRVFISVAGLHVLRQLSGIETFRVGTLLLFYQFDHQEKQIGEVVILVLRVAFAALSSCLVDKAGRRIILLVSLACTSGFVAMYGLPLVCLQHGLLIVDVEQQEQLARAVSMFALAGIMASFHFGVAPVTWVYAGEAFDQYEARAQGCSLGAVINRAADTILFLCFSPLLGWLSVGGASLLVLVPLIGGLVFCFSFITDKHGQILG